MIENPVNSLFGFYSFYSLTGGNINVTHWTLSATVGTIHPYSLPTLQSTNVTLPLSPSCIRVQHPVQVAGEITSTAFRTKDKKLKVFLKL